MIPLNSKLGRDRQLQIIMQYIYYTDIRVRHNLVIKQQVPISLSGRANLRKCYFPFIEDRASRRGGSIASYPIILYLCWENML